MHSKVVSLSNAFKVINYQCIQRFYKIPVYKLQVVQWIAYGIHGIMSTDVWNDKKEYENEYENEYEYEHEYEICLCYHLVLNTAFGKWSEMEKWNRGWLLKLLTILTQLTINTINNHCRWLSSFMGNYITYIDVIK